MGWIAGANPASSAPDTSRVKEGLRSLEFLVVVDQFMTATAELADLILPCTTYLEMDDLVDAYGHNWLGLTKPVVSPRGETKSDGEILQLLAQRLGFGEVLAGEMSEWAARVLEPLEESGLTLDMLREKPRRNPRAVAVPFANHEFATPSGKFEFVGQLHPNRRHERRGSTPCRQQDAQNAQLSGVARGPARRADRAGQPSGDCGAGLVEGSEGMGGEQGRQSQSACGGRRVRARRRACLRLCIVERRPERRQPTARSRHDRRRRLRGNASNNGHSPAGRRVQRTGRITPTSRRIRRITNRKEELARIVPPGVTPCLGAATYAVAHVCRPSFREQRGHGSPSSHRTYTLHSRGHDRRGEAHHRRSS